MQVTESGIVSRAEAGTSRAALTFPTVTALADGTVLATYRTGSNKDSQDETVEFTRSVDGGRTWSEPWRPFENPELDGVPGSLRVCYLTELAAGHLLGASMWIDRGTYPGGPLFNEETEGCLPMAVLLAESHDGGESWSPWRLVPMPVEVGPPSLTAPVLKLADGSLALSIETNKAYGDASPWMQKVVLFHSRDGGQRWAATGNRGRRPEWADLLLGPSLRRRAGRAGGDFFVDIRHGGGQVSEHSSPRQQRPWAELGRGRGPGLCRPGRAAGDAG